MSRESFQSDIYSLVSLIMPQSSLDLPRPEKPLRDKTGLIDGAQDAVVSRPGGFAG